MENKENIKMTEEQAKKQLEKGRKQAEELLKDQDKMEAFLQRLENKLNVIPMIGSTFAIVPAMISLVRSYIKKALTNQCFLILQMNCISIIQPHLKSNANEMKMK